MNMNVGGNDPRNVGENMKVGENPFDHYPSPESLWDNRRVPYHSAEFHQSFKKPRISESMRSSNSSAASLSKQGKFAKDYAQPCLKFIRGRCNYGEMCNYAHDETRNARKSLCPFGGVVADRLCKYVVTGKTCPYGGNCQFAHDAMGGSSTHRDNAAVSVPVVENSNASQMQQTNRFWRTKLCRKWDTFGNCPYGLKCQYAHGVSELRKPGSSNHLESGKSFRAESIAVDQENTASTEKPTRTSFKQKEKRCLVKLDSIVKINGIYADWIETMPPPVHVISGRQ